MRRDGETDLMMTYQAMVLEFIVQRAGKMKNEGGFVITNRVPAIN